MKIKTNVRAGCSTSSRCGGRCGGSTRCGGGGGSVYLQDPYDTGC